MSMTIGQLLDVPTLRTRLLAGGSGVDGEIMWAHSCEVPRPWEWLGPGDLLMTTGHNVPTAAADQVDFIQSLADAGVSGVALGEGMGCPPLTAQAEALADRIGFPVLATAYEVPFVLLARVVAASSQGDSQARLNRVLRVYDAYRTAVQSGLSPEQLLANISTEFGYDVHVIDAAAGRPVLSASTSLGEPALQAIRRHIGTSVTLPGITRVKEGGEEYLLVPVGTHPHWVMVVEVSGRPFDVLVLQHVNTIITIEAERRRAESETRLAVAARLMAHLIEGDVDSELVKDRLADFGLARGPWQVLTGSSDPPTRPAEVQAALDEVGIAHLVHLRADALVVLTAGSDRAVNVLVDALGESGRVGVSNLLTRISGVADAVRQADWAREACRVDGRRVSHYGADRPLFLPSTVAEAENVVRTVLGPLIDYDERHGTDLVDSLSVFFEANRSWQVASKRLQVHKQTLVYRMRRVAEVTGRRLDDLDDIAELHLALRTKELLLRS